MIWVVIFAVLCLCCFLLGLGFANRIAEVKLDELRGSMQIDSDELLITIGDSIYTESEVVEMLQDMKVEIAELKRQNEIYRAMAENRRLSNQDESEALD